MRSPLDILFPWLLCTARGGGIIVTPIPHWKTWHSESHILTEWQGGHSGHLNSSHQLHFGGQWGCIRNMIGVCIIWSLGQILYHTLTVWKWGFSLDSEAGASLLLRLRGLIPSFPGDARAMCESYLSHPQDHLCSLNDCPGAPHVGCYPLTCISSHERQTVETLNIAVSFGIMCLITVQWWLSH